MDLQRSYLHNARRKARQTRDYFDDDDDDEGSSQRSSDRASEARQNGVLGGSESAGVQENSDDIDPLDAFMAGIDVQVSQEKQQTALKRPEPTRFEDDHDSYLEELARTHKKPRATADFAGSDEEVYATAKEVDGPNEADDDEGSKRTIEALAPLDHTTLEYETFRKAFYKVHPSVAAMSAAEVEELKKELSVHTEGSDVPRPIQSFMHAGFDRKMLAMLMKLELEAPTPIQSQTFPVALSGRDMIGIAKTGSGKTLAFALPMVVHVMDQRELLKDEGPIAIVLSPTRELAHQIFVQVKKFLTVYGAQCAAVYGGVGKWDQIQVLRRGAEVVVATPGRLIDMIRKKNVKTRRVTFVVLDEADRMFEMGFEPQLRSIMGQIRPDRQTLMFSATFRKRVEALARDVLQDPVKVVIGKIGQANEDIRQVAVVVNNNNGKWPWLMANIRKLAAEGRLLIFAGSKVGCEELTKNLNAMQFYSTCLHGDKGQQERSEALAKFRSGECSILVATDVAARGLDVKDVKNVINYDVAKNIDTHVHRIGRTGRMGAEGFEPGTAYTLVTMKDTQFASQLVYNMDVSGQAVSNELLSLAKKDSRFRRGVPATAKHSSGGGDATEDGGNGLFESNSRIFDEEDERELERWTTNKPKSKTEQRKGLGFAGPVGGRPSFVRPTAGSLQQSFRMGFVKAATTESSPQLAPLTVPCVEEKKEASVPDRSSWVRDQMSRTSNPSQLSSALPLGQQDPGISIPDHRSVPPSTASVTQNPPTVEAFVVPKMTADPQLHGSEMTQANSVPKHETSHGRSPSRSKERGRSRRRSRSSSRSSRSRSRSRSSSRSRGSRHYRRRSRSRSRSRSSRRRRRSYSRSRSRSRDRRRRY